MSKKAVFYGIGSAAAALTAFFCAIPGLLLCERLSLTPTSLAYKPKKPILQGPPSPRRCQNELSLVRPCTVGQLIILSLQ